MSNTKIIDVYCKNNHLIFGRYKKVKSGFLMKCYIDEIGKDYIGASNLKNQTSVFCSYCSQEGKNNRIGRIDIVHGRPAVIINHGGVKQVKT